MAAITNCATQPQKIQHISTFESDHFWVLLYADDIAVVIKSERDLLNTLNVFHGIIQFRKKHLAL